MRTIGKDTRGAVYVEFLLVFIPVFMIFLGTVQASLMFAANLVVNHSATTAARAAAVVVDDEEKHYNNDARLTIEDGDKGESVMDKVGSLLEWAGMSSSGGSSGGGGGSSGGSGNAREGAIRSAASLPLIAVSPSMEQLISDPSVYRAIGGSAGDRALTGAAIYNRTAVAVTFPSSIGGTDNLQEFGANDDIHVRVTYLFNCAVPLANRVMCDDIVSLKTGVPLEAIQHMASAIGHGASPGEIMRMVERVQAGRDRIRRARPGIAELDHAESPNLAYLTALTGARFSVMRAEATMPNHGASYSYADDSSDSGSGGGGE